MKNWTESNLVTKAKAGDNSAFCQLVKRYQKQILFIAFDLVGNYNDACDIAQDAFLRAFEKLGQFNESAKFSTWLIRIAVNLSMDFHRQSKRAVHFSHGEIESHGDCPDTSSGPVEEFEMQEQKNEFFKNVNKLPLQQRTVVVLKFYHEKSYDEIAQIMDCSESTIRNHNARAMAKLRKYYSQLQERN